jgi:hypothetical protein
VIRRAGSQKVQDTTLIRVTNHDIGYHQIARNERRNLRSGTAQGRRDDAQATWRWTHCPRGRSWDGLYPCIATLLLGTNQQKWSAGYSFPGPASMARDLQNIGYARLVELDETFP